MMMFGSVDSGSGRRSAAARYGTPCAMLLAMSLSGTPAMAQSADDASGANAAPTTATHRGAIARYENRAYRLKINQPSIVTVRLSDLQQNLDLYIGQGDRVLHSSAEHDSEDETIQTLLKPGEYIVYVVNRDDNDAQFTIALDVKLVETQPSEAAAEAETGNESQQQQQAQAAAADAADVVPASNPVAPNDPQAANTQPVNGEQPTARTVDAGKTRHMLAKYDQVANDTARRSPMNESQNGGGGNVNVTPGSGGGGGGGGSTTPNLGGGSGGGGGAGGGGGGGATPGRNNPAPDTSGNKNKPRPSLPTNPSVPGDPDTPPSPNLPKEEPSVPPEFQQPAPDPEPEPLPQPEPDPEPELTPEPEPEPMPEPEPELEPQPEPEPEVEPEPEPLPQPQPQPQPQPEPQPETKPNPQPQPGLVSDVLDYPAAGVYGTVVGSVVVISGVDILAWDDNPTIQVLHGVKIHPGLTAAPSHDAPYNSLVPFLGGTIFTAIPEAHRREANGYVVLRMDPGTATLRIWSRAVNPHQPSRQLIEWTPEVTSVADPAAMFD